MNDEEILERLRRDEDVHPDEMNAFLFRRGLRPCPHTHHDTEESWVACTGGSTEMSIFTKKDREFLRSVRTSADTALDADRLALAKRIARHQAPGQQVVVDPDRARLQLIRLALQKLLDAAEDHES